MRTDYYSSSTMSPFGGKSLNGGRSGSRRTGSWPLSGGAGASWAELPPLARDASAEAVLGAFAGMTTDAALNHLQTQRDGLTEFEADARREFKGANVLPTHKPPSWIMTFLRAIPNPFNALLFFLAIIQLALPDRDYAGFTLMWIMISVSVGVRFWQEYRSSVAVFRLQSSVSRPVRVRRVPPTVEAVTGKTQAETKTVAERDLVPGDVIQLPPGSLVPADCMVLEASFLRVSQSTWTGESEPVAKAPCVGGGKETALFDHENVAVMGTSVVSGNGVALVLRTGRDVLIANMAKELEKKREQNAFQKGIRNVSFMLIGFMCVMVPIVLVINGKTKGDWGQAAIFSVSVAVGLVPEMLPAIVNANLARGAHVLSKMKAIARRLDSVQNIGAMSVLCSDKTGTLTKDEITLCMHVDSTGTENVSVLQLATVDAHIQGSNGNNIDAAIIAHHLPDGEPVPVAQYTKVAAIPFTFERRRSACVVRGVTGQNLLIVKGALEEVLSLCTVVREGGVCVAMDVAKRLAIERQAEEFNRHGYRVLLVAEKKLKDVEMEDEDGLRQLESEMTLEGMLTFIDPPKEDAAEAIRQLKQLNVDVKVLTGDSLPVAVNVCQALQLVSPSDLTEDDDVQAITGPELAQLGDGEAFEEAVRRCKVFAKLTPNQKAQVVGTLRDKDGHCVGMLGDGINDCMALRRADVGISVDSGASVAKDCADMILTEKGLDIIVSSVRIGRLTHGNTIKYIKMVTSSNFGNVFSVLVSSAWLPFEPMSGLQILMQNLLYDISQIAIPWDRVDEEYLTTPKRWDSWDLLRFTLVLGPTSSVFDICTYIINWFYYGVQSADSDWLVGMCQAHWFWQGLLTQTLIVHMLRTAKIPYIQSRPALPLALSTCSIMAIGFVIPWVPPFREALGFSRPAPSFVGFLVAELVGYSLEVQLVKVIYKRIFKTWL
ncbi:Mg-transporting ATPase [Purpureocillium lavendulum]|uniref:Magnesium-transporting ATPase, P-type 1 n=1 Tax=Purpureocillium lavendulum TaxID=1247861 RepID=A0AB34FHP7_9HYPO|nr:Mg-transporting ATPase [Purpureocillium lavendulum]